MNYLINRFIIFYLINIIIILDIILKIILDDNSESLLIFLTHFSLVMLVQFLLIVVFTRIWHLKKSIIYFISSFFISLNIFLFKLVNYSSIYVYLKTFDLKIMTLAVITLFIYSLYSIFKNRIVFLLFLISLPSAFTFSASIIKEINKEVERSELTEMNDIKFSQVPNVYLIGIDALAPFEIINAQLKANINFSSISRNDVIRFKNGFGFGKTGRTWNAILSLGMENNILEKNYAKSFTGQRSSLLFDIFKNNGYKIYSGIPIGWWGDKKGDLIDNYLIVRGRHDFSGCFNRNKILGIPKFFGLCTLVGERKKELYWSYYNFMIEKNPRNFDYEFENSILENVGDTERPTLFAYHLVRTAHTESDYDHTDKSKADFFRNEYLENFKYIDSFLGELYKKIKKEDPNSILLIFGDHGLQVYRSLWGNINIENSKNIFLDIYSNQIFLLKTDNKCSSHKLNSGKPYVFHHTILTGLINCLSNDPTAVNNIINSSIANKEWGFVLKSPIDFTHNEYIPKNVEHYLYE